MWRWGLFLLLIVGCARKPTIPVTAGVRSSTLEFKDVANPWGSAIEYQNGEDAGLLAILESLGGGVGVLDYDRDSYPDMLFPAGGKLADKRVEGLPSRLLRGTSQGYRDVSGEAGIDVVRHYSHGCAVGDVDNDGFPDALITGFGGLTLWKNQGDGTFIDVTVESNLDDSLWSSSAGWGDLNGDGTLDLYVAHYVNWSLENNPPCATTGSRPDVCPPRRFDPLDDVVYFGSGDGSFVNRTKECGLVSGGKGLGVLLVDVDGDADLDVYVANDTTNNFLYINDGRGGLKEQGLMSGCAVDALANANGSMGVAVTDYDNDGRPDIWVTTFEDEVFALYHGVGEGNFIHVSGNMGIQHLGALFVGFGCVAADLDLDGDEDFVVANGHVIHVPSNAPTHQEPLILENAAGKSFSRVKPLAGYFSKSWMGRGLASVDANDDGKIDLVFVNTRQPAALVLNASQSAGRSLQFQLIGRQANRQAIGATVRLILSNPDGKKYVRWVAGGGSYLSSSSTIVHFGLPEGADVKGGEVTWPGGRQTRLRAEDFANRLKDHRVSIVVEPVNEENDRER